MIMLVIGLIHLSEKYLIETLRNECKKYVYTWLQDLELTTFDEKKEFIPRHVLYKDGTRKHIASEIGIVKTIYLKKLNLGARILGDVSSITFF